MTETVNRKTVARLHNATTMLHVPIYFAPEASQEYEAAGLPKRSHYFASRTAAMGPLSAEMVEATFYNFNPAFIRQAMNGAWVAVSAGDVQLARWRAMQRILNESVRPVMSEADIDEANSIAQPCVDSMSFAGRPLAAGNAAVMADLEASDMGDDALLRLWQLVTIMREWRGDAHIALLTTEPLSAAECTVVSYAQHPIEFIKTTRAWSDAEWDSAAASMVARGWLNDEGKLTEEGQGYRKILERNTNELAAAMWNGIDDQTANRLGDLLDPAVAALRQAGAFSILGIHPD